MPPVARGGPAAIFPVSFAEGVVRGRPHAARVAASAATAASCAKGPSRVVRPWAPLRPQGPWPPGTVVPPSRCDPSADTPSDRRCSRGSRSGPANIASAGLRLVQRQLQRLHPLRSFELSPAELGAHVHRSRPASAPFPNTSHTRSSTGAHTIASRAPSSRPSSARARPGCGERCAQSLFAPPAIQRWTASMNSASCVPPFGIRSPLPPTPCCVPRSLYTT